MDSIEQYRPYLFSVAYNILGEVQEAEDMVQEAFAYYFSLEEGKVQNLKSYLTRVVANKSIDRLKELKKQRESYPGTWLPEPYIQMNLMAEAPKDIMSYEVLNALEELNPLERAVFVLREAFDFSYHELADICNTTETNCRQIMRRTRQKVASQKSKEPVNNDRLMQLMEVFMKAVAEEDISALTRLLKEDIVLYSDGGGKAAAAVNPLWGADIVSKFLIGIYKKNKDRNLIPTLVKVNGQVAILLSSSSGPETLMSFNKEEESLSQIFIMRNPDKFFSHMTVTK